MSLLAPPASPWAFQLLCPLSQAESGQRWQGWDLRRLVPVERGTQLSVTDRLAQMGTAAGPIPVELTLCRAAIVNSKCVDIPVQKRPYGPGG